MAFNNIHLLGFVFIILINTGVFSSSTPRVYYKTDHAVPENTPVSCDRSTISPYNPSNTVNTTLLSTYNDILYDWSSNSTTGYVKDYNMGHSGHVYGFYLCAVYSEPIKISIWRWNLRHNYIPWGGVIYMEDEAYNGQYTLVHITETVFPVVGENYFYLETGVWVEPNDFLGITYGKRNPIPYDVVPDHDNLFYNVHQTCDLDSCVSSTEGWPGDDWYGYSSEHQYHSGSVYHFSHIEPDVRMYSLQALLTDDFSHPGCQMFQLTNDTSDYELVSHPDYGHFQYESNYENCWFVRAADNESVIYADVINFKLETSDHCQYDYLHVTGGDVYSEFYCGVSDISFMITPIHAAHITFHTDSSVEEDGFHLKLHSVNKTVYDDYLSKGSPSTYIWPWNVDTDSIYSESTEAAASSDSDIDLELAAKIGIAVGASILGIIVLGIMIACCYVCCCKTNAKKVSPATTMTKTATTSVNTQALPYPRQGYVKRPPQQTGVYMIPQGTTRSLPPLSTGMPRYPTMPQPPPPQQHHQSNYPPQGPPPPYPTQRYQQPPVQPPQQPTPLPPRQPLTQPKHSLSTVAFALVQPKPLKRRSDSFGGGTSGRKTEGEMMALGRARLNWGVTIIPAPASYVEPQQWRQGMRGSGQSVPPPLYPPSQNAMQNFQFAENDVSYTID